MQQSLEDPNSAAALLMRVPNAEIDVASLSPMEKRRLQFESFQGLVNTVLNIDGLTAADRARAYELALESGCFTHWDENLNDDLPAHRRVSLLNVWSATHGKISTQLKRRIALCRVWKTPPH